MSSDAPRILYCHCQYAQVIPKEVKEAVLNELCARGIAFEAVADLCEMSARGDAAITRLASGGPVKIAACFPRAVKWLFHQAGAPLDLSAAQVLNMRTLPAAEIVAGLLNTQLNPNLPTGKVTAPAPTAETEPAPTPAAV